MADDSVPNEGESGRGAAGEAQGNGVPVGDLLRMYLENAGDDDEDFDFYTSDEEDDEFDNEEDYEDFDLEDYEENDLAFLPRYSSSDELESSESEGEEEPGPSLVLNDHSMVAHGIGSTVPHHQCCDALALCSLSPDEVIMTDQQHAVLYNVSSRQLLAVVDMCFEPYSITWHGAFFAAGDDEAIKVFYIDDDPTKKDRKRFQLAAWFKVGCLQQRSGMNNGLRFGLCGSEVRLLVSNQDGYVYVFSVPTASSVTAGSAARCFQPSDFLCTNLRAGTRSADKQLQFVSWREANCRPIQMATEVIGRFKAPVNCAVASPDGEFLAAVGDDTCVWLLDHASGYSSSHMMTLSCKPEPQTHTERHRGYHGCQYVAWNASSQLLAASSDTLASVTVWAVRPLPAAMRRKKPPAGECAVVDRIGTFMPHARPCMALQFSPEDDQLLYYVERSGRLHCVDMRSPSLADQVISLKPRLQERCESAFVGCWGGHTEKAACSRSCYRRWEKEVPRVEDGGDQSNLELALNLRSDYKVRRITGLGVSESLGVLVATTHRLLSYQALARWTPELHRHFPHKFKRCVQWLLGASLLQTETHAPAHPTGHPVGFWSLPKEVLCHIFGLAALPVSAWLDAPALTGEPSHFQQSRFVKY